MIVSREEAPSGTTVLVTQFDGEDDDRPAEIRMAYSPSPNALSISKETSLNIGRDAGVQAIVIAADGVHGRLHRNA